MTRMRDECIALEAVSMTTRVLAAGERKTTGQIAEEAIAKVDAACAAGELGFLHRSWAVDPETGR